MPPASGALSLFARRSRSLGQQPEDSNITVQQRLVDEANDHCISLHCISLPGRLDWYHRPCAIEGTGPAEHCNLLRKAEKGRIWSDPGSAAKTQGARDLAAIPVAVAVSAHGQDRRMRRPLCALQGRWPGHDLL